MVKDKVIPKGYKQTDVGVIPEDWEIWNIDSLCIRKGLVRGPFGGSLKKECFTKSGYKVYEQRNAIYKNFEIGNYYINESKFIEMKRFAIKGDDLIVSCSGTIGKIFKIPNTAPIGIINQALLKITLDNSIINDRYFIYYFEWEQFQNRIIDNTQGGAMKNLVGMDVFKNTKLGLPKKNSEQKAIAQVLSDTDELITSLEKLITKKKNIKQGAMQELLTGKRRLPGFQRSSGYKQTDVGVIPEDWEIKHISELGLFKKGKGIKKDEVTNLGLPCIRYGEIYTKYNFVVKKINSFISIASSKKSEQIKKGDILFAGSGETAEEIGKCVVSLYDFPVFAGGDIIILAPEFDDSLFLGYSLNNNIINKQKAKKAQGDAIVHIY